MTWIRRNIRPGTWLALMALALHLVMTFGHIHAEPFSPPPASMAAAPVIATDALAADDDDSTAERYRTLRAHHHCAVCTSIDLLGTSILPVRQMVPPRRAVPGSGRLNPSDIAPPHERRSFSKARAPPSA
jgi:hypothetical protein